MAEYGQVKMYYARWQNGEVDMVKLDESNINPQWAVEIKWSNQYYEKPGDLKPLLYFMKENQIKEALVTTIDKQGVKEVDGVFLHFIPAALYAYSIGRNTLLEVR